MTTIQPLQRFNALLDQIRANKEPKKEESFPLLSSLKEICSSSSTDGHGAVNLKLRDLHFEKLQKKAAPGVAFSEQYLSNVCYGGTCSAQTLNFANTFFNQLKEGLSTDQAFKVAAKKHKTSSLEIRTEQAALNAITEDKNTYTSDFQKAKVESIVALKDFKVLYDTKEISTEGDTTSIFNQFKQEIEKMPEGVFFVRILYPFSNHKKEAYGHSVFYVHDKDRHYFWDPMGPAYQLSDANVIKELFTIMKQEYSRWGVSKPRFYKILPEELVIDEPTENSNLSFTQRLLEKTIHKLSLTVLENYVQQYVFSTAAVQYIRLAANAFLKRLIA